MRRFGTLALVACIAALAPATLAQEERTCARLTRPYMSTTTDGGATFIPFRIPPMQAPPLTWGLAALDDAGTLVMQADGALWGSENDGCNWTKLPGDAAGIFRVAEGPGGYAYAWQDNGGDIFRVVHGSTPRDRWTVTYFKGPISDMHGFVVDPADPLHVRTAGNPGQIYESFDGGASWRGVGVPAVPGGFLGYVTAFDPNDLDHAVYGRVTNGGFVTFDGGQTWTQSTGLAAVAGGSVNLFNAVVSPADGNTVFAAALDSSTGSSVRSIYVSTDGGFTFSPVATSGVGGVFLQNQPVMHADRTDPNVVRFLFSVSPVFGGTYFYTYDLGSNSLTTVQNGGLPIVREFIQSRFAPGSLHVGFEFN